MTHDEVRRDGGNLPRAPGFPFWAAAWAIIVNEKPESEL